MNEMDEAMSKVCLPCDREGLGGSALKSAFDLKIISPTASWIQLCVGECRCNGVNVFA